MGKAELKLEIDAMLLKQARAADIQLSILVERALKEALGPDAAAARAQRWSEENADAVASHNKFIEEFGPFGEDLRTW